MIRPNLIQPYHYVDGVDAAVLRTQGLTPERPRSG